MHELYSKPNNQPLFLHFVKLFVLLLPAQAAAKGEFVARLRVLYWYGTFQPVAIAIDLLAPAVVTCLAIVSSSMAEI